MKTPGCPVKSLSLDDAISHADEVAGDCSTSCEREHKQLADWLRELKSRRSAERGNAAKMREALEAIIIGYENADLCDMNYGEWCHEPANICVNVPLCKAIHEARAALSAPPRNCDRFATIDEARKAHEAICEKYGKCHHGCPLNNEEHYSAFDCFEAWLFAQAEGGAK